MNVSELKDNEIPTPPGIATEFIQDERSCQRYGQIAVAYDFHTQVGGMWHFGMKEWVLWWPLSPEQYAYRVSRAVEACEHIPVNDVPDVLN